MAERNFTFKESLTKFYLNSIKPVGYENGTGDSKSQSPLSWLDIDVVNYGLCSNEHFVSLFQVNGKTQADISKRLFPPGKGIWPFDARSGGLDTDQLFD
ncbi:hypothetical protein WSM22_05000 [Cytophagales bacterium WSM2-2]|nr:hypothetical protein WSM22_05000 [Cytophagales bacterium WSM2-2]